MKANIAHAEAFSKIIKLLHEDELTDPQYARVWENDRSVTYAFRLYGIRDILDGRRALILSNGDREMEMIRTYAALLNIQVRQYNLIARPGTENDLEGIGTVIVEGTMYSKKGFEKVLETLYTIPLDGGKLPAKGTTFFGYD